MKDFPKYEYKYRVYYEHTDGGGVVYHSRYLNFFERARTDWLRENGMVQSEMQKELNLVYVVTAADIKYKKPARMDDALTVSSQLMKIKRASMEIYQEMTNQDNELLATVLIKAACLQADNFRVIALPKKLREDLMK